MLKVAHNPSLKSRLRIGFLILCFGILTGFSPFLHAHELDLFEPDHDCAPCNWSQSQTSVETVAPQVDELSSTSLQLESIQESVTKGVQHTYSGRSPPLHS